MNGGPTRKQENGPGPVVWVDPDRGYGFARKLPTPKYRNPGKPTRGYAARMVIGSIMVTSRKLRMTADGCDGYPYPQLVSRGPGAPLQKGSIVIYLGETMTKERARVAHQPVDLNVVKHLFLVPGAGSFIVHDLSYIRHC